MTRSEISVDPRTIIRDQIRKGDTVECWTPVMVPADPESTAAANGFRFQPCPTGAMQLASTGVAARTDYDGAGRWTSEDGSLIHAGHPYGFSDEHLLLVNRVEA